MSGISAKLASINTDPASHYVFIQGKQSLDSGTTNITIKRVGVDYWLGVDGWQPTPCRIVSELLPYTLMQDAVLLKLDRRLTNLIPYGSGVEIFIENCNLVMRIRWDKPVDLESISTKIDQKINEARKTVVVQNLYNKSNRNMDSDASTDQVDKPQDAKNVSRNNASTNSDSLSNSTGDPKIEAFATIANATEKQTASENSFLRSATHQNLNSQTAPANIKNINKSLLIAIGAFCIVAVAGFIYLTSFKTIQSNSNQRSAENQLAAPSASAYNQTNSSEPGAVEAQPLRGGTNQASPNNETRQPSTSVHRSADNSASTRRENSESSVQQVQCDVPEATHMPAAAGFRADLQIQQVNTKISEGKLVEAEQTLKRFVKTGNSKAAELLGELLDPTRGAKLRSDPNCSLQWYNFAEFMGLDMSIHKLQLEKWRLRNP